MHDFGTFDELDQLVAENGNLIDVTMAQLRDAARWDRLTGGAIKVVEDQLGQRGLGHFPALTENRHQTVRIFKNRTDLGKLVEAVLSPTDGGDKELREAANRDADQLVRRIRELVCD